MRNPPMPRMSRGRMIKEEEIKPRQKPQLDDELALVRKKTLTGEVVLKNKPKNPIEAIGEDEKKQGFDFKNITGIQLMHDIT